MEYSHKLLLDLARLAGFEPATYGLEVFKALIPAYSQ